MYFISIMIARSRDKEYLKVKICILIILFFNFVNTVLYSVLSYFVNVIKSDRDSSRIE